MKVSFDFDGVLTTRKGIELALRYKTAGDDLYIISARKNKGGMIDIAGRIGIPQSKVFATGSNTLKVQKIKELGIDKHIDNNIDVIHQIGSKGVKFEMESEESILNQIEEMVNHPKLTDDYKYNEIENLLLEFKIIYGNTRTKNKTIKSSNVWKFKYNDKTNELVVQFQDGSIYTYSGVSLADFESFSTGLGGVCKTSGENRWGSWEEGKTPSVGAAVWDVLMKYDYKRGGQID